MDITYGTALDSTQLNATASFKGGPVAGTFSYTPGAGTVLNAGSGQAPGSSVRIAYNPSRPARAALLDAYVR